ncbi:MAG TPA: hypothetical protein VIC62_18120 [Nakamurella sp.]|jgi:hypothetical protein
MTAIAGLIFGLIAGWFVPDARRAAITAAVPWLVVVVGQTAGLALGYGESPPSTVTQWPDLIGYWLVQLALGAACVGIAAELGALRAGRGDPGRAFRATIGPLTVAAFLVMAGYLTLATPQPHSPIGEPPVYGLVSMAVSILTLIVLTALLVHRRVRTHRTPAAV